MLIVVAERFGHGVVVPPLLCISAWEMWCQKMGRDLGQRNPLIISGLSVDCVTKKEAKGVRVLCVHLFNCGGRGAGGQVVVTDIPCQCGSLS